jgi:hypothetical protein
LQTISVKSLSRLQCHSAAGRIRSTQKSSDRMGNRVRNLPAFTISWENWEGSDRGQSEVLWGGGGGARKMSR